MTSFQNYSGSLGFWRRGSGRTSCTETFYLQVPNFFGCLGEWIDTDSLDCELKTHQYRCMSGGSVYCIHDLPFTTGAGCIGLLIEKHLYFIVNKIFFNRQPRRPVCVTSRPSLRPQRAVFLCCLPVSDGTSSRRLRAARGVYLWPAGSAPLSQLPKQSHSTLCWVHQCSADTHTQAHTHRCTLQKMPTMKC